MIYLLEERVFLIFQEAVKKYGKRVLPIIPFLILILYFLFSEDSSNEEVQIESVPQNTIQEKTHEKSQNNNENSTSEKVIVDIKGAVKHPGVYELTTNDRIIDAIQMAGGYTKKADSTTVNHAQKLQDEMVIYIPKKGEDVAEQLQALQSPTSIVTSGSSSNAGNTSSSSSANKVNINTANETELTSLSGIGPAKAKAIVSYREENGPFKSVEDIKNVSGIGDKTFEKLKDSITVN